MRKIFIINPSAGKGHAFKKLLPILQKKLSEKNDSFEIFKPKSGEDSKSYCHNISKTGENVGFYACGGDGTLNNVLNSIANFENAYLGCVAYGTGNDFVRNFTNPNHFTSVRAVLNGNIQKLDVMRYNKDKYAINMFNLGLDSQIAARVPENKKIPFIGALFAYIISIFQVLPHRKPFDLTIELDNGEIMREKLLLICIANGAFCGGGFKSAPLAKLDDNLLDICAIRPLFGLDLIRALIKYRFGEHINDKENHRYMIYKKCKSVKISSDTEFPIAVDGEINYMKEIEIESIPSKLNFIMPENSKLL